MKAASLIICIFAIETAFGADTKPPIPNETQTSSGHAATPGQFPWQAALFFQKESDSSFWFCSGSIIGKEWILTSAHCTNEAQSVLVYAGIVDISQEVQPTAISKQFVIHEKFAADSFEGDVALIKLTQSLFLNDKIQTIGFSSDKIKSGESVTLSSWSQTNENGTKVNALLNYADFETVDNEKCQKLLDVQISSSEFLCIIASPVPGDNGGPVIVDFDSKPSMVAIISLVSHNENEDGFVSGFTILEPYLDWIKEKTGIQV